MLSIQPPTQKTQNHTPNLLPCRLHHDGPINASSRYWNPTADSNKSKTSYFRGRKLHGKPIPLPSGYSGAILKITDKIAPPQTSRPTVNSGREEVEEAEEREDVKVVERLGKFDEVVVWGHESLEADIEDVYVRGVGEWIGFAEAMHGDEGEVVQGR